MGQRPGAPAYPDNVNVVEQKAVYLHGGNLAASEADDQQPSSRSKRAQRIGEPVAADRVYDDVDTTAVRQLLYRVLEPLGQHHICRPGHCRKLGLLLRADHRDGARRPERRR
ncbi:Uncharacterised protein [Mycobacterium tuberculosis]|nr:Uncharacterised protein [Mycobacterium tuberculosis]